MRYFKVALLIFCFNQLFAQLPNIFYQYAPPGTFQKMVGNTFGVGFGMYGRVGASWNFVEEHR